MTSSDVILVHNVHSGYDDVEEGGRVMYDGTYYKEEPDQMISGNLRLARSRESGNRVLYFVKEDHTLVFDGVVEYVAHGSKNDPARPGALAFELKRVDADPQGASVDRHGDPPSSHASSAPDLDMIVSVERKISDRGSFASRSELLAALPMGIDSAKLDRILEYLESSAKVSTGGGHIRWASSGSGAHEGSNAGKEDSGSLATTAADEEPVHILSMAERLSADLDNDLPYSEETERVIADCEAGRPIGKTYTAEEYLRYLDQEFGTDAADSAEG